MRGDVSRLTLPDEARIAYTDEVAQKRNLLRSMFGFGPKGVNTELTMS